MKSYNLITVRMGDSIAVDNCTDATTLEWIIQEVRKFFPRCHVQEYQNRLTSQKYKCFISKLEGMQLDVYIWLLQRLCQRGWEPFYIDDAKVGFKLETNQ